MHLVKSEVNRDWSDYLKNIYQKVLFYSFVSVKETCCDLKKTFSNNFFFFFFSGVVHLVKSEILFFFG